MSISEYERIVLRDIAHGRAPTAQSCRMDNPEFCNLVEGIQNKRLIEGLAYTKVGLGAGKEPLFDAVKRTPLGKQELGE